MSVNASLRPVSVIGSEPAAYDTACWLIIWATLFDVLDGKLAKLTGTSSDFGMRLDTFADATTFGLAPAVLIYCAFLSPTQMASPWGWIAAGCYFTSAVFRLARYNVISTRAASFGFVGVPTPTAALIAVSLYLSHWGESLPATIVALIMLLIAVTMVSPLRYPAFKGLYPVEKKIILALLTSMAAATCFVGPAKVLLVTFGSFALFWGPLWVPTRKLWNPELRSKVLRTSK